MSDSSPFLDVPRAQWLVFNASAFAIPDASPIAPGHSLVVSRRELASWWDLSLEERHHMLLLVDELRLLLKERHQPDGFTVGIDDGAAAGQQVPHAHIQVIPRYRTNPEQVPPNLRSILTTLPVDLRAREDVDEVFLVDGLEEGFLRQHLTSALEDTSFDRIDLLVSFIMRSGLNLVERHLENALARGARVRVLTTDYMNITHPDAIARLQDLARIGHLDDRRGSIELRVFQDPSTSFHPKAYLFWASGSGRGRGFVGSNNLSRSGIYAGVEWAVRTSQLDELIAGFERIWADPRSREVDDEWLDSYSQRAVQAVSSRSAEQATVTEKADTALEDEPEYVAPQPREIQERALEALEKSRAAGHKAGLVVLATGLGKTWLSAFDSSRPEFRRVLFVAHREEILRQTRDVFRAVRPEARLGFFTGAEKVVDADAVFAGVQTLRNHLASFGPGDFDYIVVDEFHHASAGSYRRVLNHFEPHFLLGLTATPDRLDGADLLALCGDNLVFRCDLSEGIERKQLAPFHYWGVADTVDFRPLPWRNGRFDPQALDSAVVTQERADAAYREWSQHGGDRTLAFCVSIRHADYMAQHFERKGVPAASLHSRSEPALRTRLVQELEAGRLRVLFTVDLFNEGVDVPTIDTVLMLRPTESPVLFLQQLGRGLRTAMGKSHLDVVDFVGNHRSFLTPLRTLLALRLGRPPTSAELDAAVREGSIELPAECSIDYSLDAIAFLQSLVRERRSSATDVLRDLCIQLAEEEGVRPTALQVALAGGNIRAARTRSGGWFQLLDELGMLDDGESEVIRAAGDFLHEVATGAMTKSFKMVLLQALLHDGQLRDGMPLAELSERSLKIIQGDPRLMADVDPAEFPNPNVVETLKWERYWNRNPVNAWAGGDWFIVANERFVPKFQVDKSLGDAFDAMTAELVEWRLHDYFERGPQAAHAGSLPLRVSHAGGSPIIRLDRARFPRTPEGDVEFLADGEMFVGRFVKVALNTATKGSADGNALPALLRRWFGPAAGHPGSDHKVILKEGAAGWVLQPSGRIGSGEVESLPFFPTYAVACGAFGAPVPADVAPKRRDVVGLTSVDPDEFLVNIRGESMAGGEAPLHHGDLVRLRWTKRKAVADLVGKSVLVELDDNGDRKPVLKQLSRDGGGYLLHSTGLDVDDIRASERMTVVGELVDKIDPSAWNPIGRWLGHEFDRKQVPSLFDEDFNFGRWGMSGHITLDDDSVLFVTTEKKSGQSGAEYVDRFESPDEFHWTSQNKTAPDSPKGREILDALDTARRIHLFARRRNSEKFVYCGTMAPLRHEGSEPMSVWFRMLTPLDRNLQRRFSLAQ